MTTDVVLYETVDRVATITLNRPDVSNALDMEMAHRLHKALRRAERDDVAAVVLAGSGRLFCGGGDLAAMAAAADRPRYVAELARVAHEAVMVLDSLRKPVVTAVQGAAAGIGLSLVLGSDLVVAGESARFVTAYTSVGLTPDGGMSWRLPRMVGQRVASEMIMLSKPIGAERARDLGIVSTICTDEEVLATAQAMASDLATRPAHALAAARRLVRDSWSNTLTSHLDLEAAAIAEAAGVEETAAMINRFVQGS